MATVRNKASKDARPRKRLVNDVPPDMDLRLEEIQEKKNHL